MKTAFVLVAALAVVATGCQSMNSSDEGPVQPYSSTRGPTPPWPPPAPDTMDNPAPTPVNPTESP